MGGEGDTGPVKLSRLAVSRVGAVYRGMGVRLAGQAGRSGGEEQLSRRYGRFGR